MTLSVRLQNVDILRPVQPQGHDLPQDPVIPTNAPFIDDIPAPSKPTSDPAIQPAQFNPTALPVPYNPRSSSSSESAEGLVKQQQPPAGPYDSSSEEIGGPVALRPPFSFRYQRHDRKKRQALTDTSPSHNPVFLSNFPSGPSPFRSCPGPARYTTV